MKGCSLCASAAPMRLQDSQASSRIFPAHKAGGYPSRGSLAPMVLVWGLHWSQLWEHHPALLKTPSHSRLVAETYSRAGETCWKATGDVGAVAGRRQKGEEAQQGRQGPRVALVSLPAHPDWWNSPLRLLLSPKCTLGPQSAPHPQAPVGAHCSFGAHHTAPHPTHWCLCSPGVDPGSRNLPCTPCYLSSVPLASLHSPVPSTPRTCALLATGPGAPLRLLAGQWTGPGASSWGQ